MSAMQIDESIAKAVEHQQAGRLVEAEGIYREILAVSPGNVIVTQLLGTVELERGRWSEAIKLIGQAIDMVPGVAPFHNNLGNSLRGSGELDAAIQSYQRAVELDPRFAKAYINLGNACSDAKQWNEAVSAYSAGIQLDPMDTDAQYHFANALWETGQFDRAADAGRRAVELNPDFAEAHTNLGTSLKQLGKLEEAITCHEKAIALRPDLAEAHCNLGVAQADSGKLEQALDSLRRAIELEPEYGEGWANLAVVLCNLGQGEESRVAGERALQLAGDIADARCNIAQVFLTLGDFENGLREYETRWKANPRIRAVPFAQPRWNGEELTGKTILLHAEQGLGDSIHFVRYVPLVAWRASRVILECQPELVELFRGVSGVDQIIPAGQPLPEFDVHCPLMSLPLVMGTTLVSVPSGVPYINAPQRKELMGRGAGLNVGLVWAGRPTHSNDRNRSMKLNDFGPLGMVEGVTFHTLQKGMAAAEALSPPAGMALVDHGPKLRDFVDTASVINELDLVIAVDTSVAHLAGALGKAVWVLLPFVADWRWMRDREDSPWYPTMRLFRQKRWGDWAEPLEQIARVLAEISGPCGE